MNVLILTPDAVGSTLLQRTLTAYMQFYEFDRPVINLHELTNGLTKYYSPEFNQEVLGKPEKDWGYYQSLSEIVDILESVSHYKTSRLANYHILNRKDKIKEQVPFYNYLNQNFFIISCRRENIFEHALSWEISKTTKKLNVYSPLEKIQSFINLYESKMTIDQKSLENSLNSYKLYLEWCKHFEISSYFEYETNVPNIEKFITDLPIFPKKEKIKRWQDVYGITFEDWNKCHFYTGDIGSVALNNKEKYKSLISNIESPPENVKLLDWESDAIKQYNRVADESWPHVDSLSELKNLDPRIKEECENVHMLDFQNQRSFSLSSHLDKYQLDFLIKNKDSYMNAYNSMQKMVDLGIMISPPPLKKQTLEEKKLLVKNFNECVDTYNRWSKQNCEISTPLKNETINDKIVNENKYWRPKNENLLDKL